MITYLIKEYENEEEVCYKYALEDKVYDGKLRVFKDFRNKDPRYIAASADDTGFRAKRIVPVVARWIRDNKELPEEYIHATG